MQLCKPHRKLNLKTIVKIHTHNAHSVDNIMFYLYSSILANCEHGTMFTVT